MNALSETVVTESPIVRVVRDVHPSNALLPTVVADPKFIELIFEQPLNVDSGIVVVFPHTTPVRPEHFSKTLLPMAVTVSGTVTVPILVQP